MDLLLTFDFLCDLLYSLLYSESTTNRISGVWALRLGLRLRFGEGSPTSYHCNIMRDYGYTAMSLILDRGRVD